MGKRFASLDQVSALHAAREHDRFVYNHKYPMKEDAFQKVLEQRVDSPKLISNAREFNAAVKDRMLANQIVVQVPNPNAAFVRNTRMGGHLSQTLGKAGLTNLGLVQRNVTFSLTRENKPIEFQNYSPTLLDDGSRSKLSVIEHQSNDTRLNVHTEQSIS